MQVRSKNYKPSDEEDKGLKQALVDINERLTLLEKKISELELASHTH